MEAGANRSAVSRRLSIAIVLCAVVPWPCQAADLELQSVGVRIRVGESRVLGKEQPESFHEYDIAAAIRLPWEARLRSGWGVGVTLLAGAGALEGAGKVAMVVSAIPVLAAGTADGRFDVDMGLGVALLSQHRYAQQDYGGPVQAALTFGVGVPLYDRFGIGYRFMHYSDAGAYGANTIGADFHMVELKYRF